MIFDIHNDFLTEISSENIEAAVNKFSLQGLKGLIAPVWTSEIVNNCQSEILRLTSPLKRLKTAYPVCYALEDLHFLTEQALEAMDFSVYKYCSLTWNYENKLAYGAHDSGGLKPFGKKVLTALENAHCAIDCAHLNKQSFYDVADNAYALINSHTSFNGFYNHCRNIDDDQIKEIISRGGIIGICLVCGFLGDNTAKTVANAIDYFVQKFGVKNLAIGSDFYGTKDLPVDITDYDGFNNLRNYLTSFGYANDNIDDIFFNNAKRYFKI